MSDSEELRALVREVIRDVLPEGLAVNGSGWPARRPDRFRPVPVRSVSVKAMGPNGPGHPRRYGTSSAAR